MNKLFYAILILVFSFSILSCGGSGNISDSRINNTKSFQADRDRIWEEIISVFGDLNYPIKVLEKNSYFIQSDEVSISNEDVYSFTQIEGGDYRGGKMSFNIYLKSIDNTGTEVKISSTFTGFWQYTGYNYKETGAQNLYSNGKIENIIFNRINERLGIVQIKENKEDSKNAKVSGSGFLISQNGYVVTNSHVINGEKKIEIIFPDKNIKKTATIKVEDQQNDLAILELQNFTYSDISYQDIPFTFAPFKDIKIGQDVFTLGFPLGDIMGKDSRLSTGVIQSLYGIQDDPRVFQINNPIQPGNSGGALFNRKGELVGICVSSLDAITILKYTGTLPQNVNFAIKGSFLMNLISSLKESEEILARTNTVIQDELDKQIEQLNPFIVQVKVY